MTFKTLYSLSLLAFVLGACGETKTEKDLKRKNKELQADNATLIQETTRARADESAANASNDRLRNQIAAQNVQIEELNAALKKSAADLKDAQDKARSIKSEKTALETERDTELASKDKEIDDLKTRLAAADNSAEVDKLNQKIESLNQEKTQLESSYKAKIAEKDQALQTANAQVANLDTTLKTIFKKSVTDVQGLWINPDKIPAIAGASCYELAFVKDTGSFVQGIACQDGRVQLTTSTMESFSALKVTGMPADADFGAPYGFAVNGSVQASTCADAGSSLQKAGRTLAFEMTQQEFGTEGSRFVSQNMAVVTGAGAYKNFQFGASIFGAVAVSNADTLAFFAARNGNKPLATSSAAFLKAVEGKNANQGCFDAAGTFAPVATN